MSFSFREPPFSVEMSPLFIKQMYFVLSTFTWSPMPLAPCSRLCCRDSDWAGIIAGSAMSSV